MKRGTKLIAMLAVLALLLGIAWAAAQLEPETSVGEEAAVIFTLDTSTVTCLSWTYQGETLSFDRADGLWTNSDDPDFPVDSAPLEAMLTTLSQITADKTIVESDDLAQYGLEEPICAVTVTAGDTVCRLNIGAETALGGQRYFTLGDSTVYLVDQSVNDAFCFGRYDLVQEESIPDLSVITELDVSYEDQTFTIQRIENSALAYSDAYIYFLNTAAGCETLDTELTESLLENLSGLSWLRCADYRADDLSAYGLAEPSLTVTAEYEITDYVDSGETDESGSIIYEPQTHSASFTLELGSQTDEGCYARIAGSDMVYLVSADVYEVLRYTSYADLRPDEVLIMDWDTVTDFDVRLNGSTYHIQRTVQETEDEDGSLTETVVYLLDEQELAISSALTTLTELSSTGYATGLTPEGTEEISFTIRRENESYPETVLTIYQYNAENCLVQLDGESTVLVSRSDIVALTETITQLLLGG